METMTREKLDRKRRRRDTQEIILAVLNSPLKRGPVFDVDGETPIKEIASKNLDVQTRMILEITHQALEGDLKAAQFLMKYGGLEPASASTVTIQVPQFIDDLQMVDITPDSHIIEESAKASIEGPMDDEKKDSPVIEVISDDDRGRIQADEPL